MGDADDPLIFVFRSVSMRAEPLDLRVSRVGEGGFAPYFDYSRGTTEDIKRKVWFDTTEQNKYLSSLNDQIDGLWAAPGDEDRLNALKDQITDVKKSNSDPMAFEFNRKLQERVDRIDFNLARIQEVKSYFGHSDQWIDDSLNADTVPRKINQENLVASLDYSLAEIKEKQRNGTIEQEDVDQVKRLLNLMYKYGYHYMPADMTQQDIDFGATVQDRISDATSLLNEIKTMVPQPAPWARG